MGDNTWVHHFDPKSKWQLMQWQHMTSPSKKKFGSVPSARKAWSQTFVIKKALFLWTSCIQKVNSYHYVGKQKTLNSCPHYNTRLHTSVCTTHAITNFVCSVSISTIQSSTHTNRLSPLSLEKKKTTRTPHTNNEALGNGVRRQLQWSKNDFYLEKNMLFPNLEDDCCQWLRVYWKPTVPSAML